MSGGLPVDVNVRREVAAGFAHPYAGIIDFNSVDLNFVTKQIDDIIPVIVTDNALGFAFGSGKTVTGINVYLAKWECNAPASSGHRLITLHEGCFAPSTLSVDHRGDLQMGCTLKCVSPDGGATSPWTINDAASLPALTAAKLAARWKMSEKCLINNVAVTGKTSINVDFGAQLDTVGADGESANSRAVLRQMAPTVTVQGLHPTWAEAVMAILGATVQHSGVGIGIAGSSWVPMTATDPAAGADTHFFFRKHNVADSTAQHIGMSVSGGAHFTDAGAGGQTDDVSATLQIHATRDAVGNYPLLFEAAVDINTV